MSRYLGRPDSVYSNSQDFLQASVLNGVATGAINANELCLITQSAQVIRVDPNLPWAAINQTNPAPYQVFPSSKWVTVTLTSMTIAKTCGYPVRLSSASTGSSRNFAVPVQSSSGIGFVIRTSAGLEVTNYINVSADASTCVPYCAPLQNGNFVIMWHVSASLKFAIYDPNGNQIAAPATVSTTVLTSGMVQWHGHCVLGNGNFALTWATTGGALVGIIYGPTGSVVVAQFTIDASSTGQAHVCAPCANGDFLAGCYDASHTKHSLYRITNAGSVTWGPVARSSATAPFSWPDQARQHPQHNRLCELAGPVSATPNICWMLPNSAGYCNAYVHASTGSLVKASDVGTAYHNVNCQDPVTLMPFGFCTAHAPSTGIQSMISVFDWNGNAIGQNTQVDANAHQFPQGVTPNIAFYTGYCGAAVAISRYCGGPSYGGVEHRLIHCDQQGNTLGTPFNVQPFGPDDIGSPAPNCDLDGSAFITNFTSTTLQINAVMTKVGLSGVIGVAQAGAVSGGSVVINGQGSFVLPTTQVFGPGNAFDMRDLPVLGCRGMVEGQVAILGGWSL